jgi:transcriptional regulator with XRE-family HTH domain
MRAHRQQAGLDQEAVAKALRCSVAKVSYAETGDRPFRLRDLEEVLLDLYGISKEHWGDYLWACERSHQKGWWDAYDEDIVPPWYRRYLGLEQGASRLRGFLLQLVPGLLQTPDYARAIMTSAASGLDPEEAAGRTEVRLRRQELLTRDEPLDVHYVLDEAVLRRVVGSRDIMRDQLAHLIALADRPNVTLQVLTFTQGYYWDGKGEPVILSFPWPDDPGVVYVENRLDGECLERDADVRGYTQAFDHLQRTALAPVESVAMMQAVAKDYE